MLPVKASAISSFDKYILKHYKYYPQALGSHIESDFSPPGDYCNLPLYMKSDPFFRKQSEHHDPCPVVPPREASIRGLAQRAYHTQGRHVTMDSAKQQALTMGHSGLSNLTSSGASSGATGGVGGGSGSGGVSASSSSSTLPQRTLTMPGSSASVSQSAAAAAAATAAAAGVSSSSGGSGVAGATGGTPGGASSSSSKMGGSRDSLLESSSSGLGRLQKQRDGGAGAYSKSYTLV